MLTQVVNAYVHASEIDENRLYVLAHLLLFLYFVPDSSKRGFIFSCSNNGYYTSNVTVRSDHLGACSVSTVISNVLLYRLQN